MPLKPRVRPGHCTWYQGELTLTQKARWLFAKSGRLSPQPFQLQNPVPQRQLVNFVSSIIDQIRVAGRIKIQLKQILHNQYFGGVKKFQIFQNGLGWLMSLTILKFCE